MALAKLNAYFPSELSDLTLSYADALHRCKTGTLRARDPLNWSIKYTLEKYPELTLLAKLVEMKQIATLGDLYFPRAPLDVSEQLPAVMHFLMQKMVRDEEWCQYIFSRGPNKDDPCERKTRDGLRYCNRHKGRIDVRNEKFEEDYVLNSTIGVFTPDEWRLVVELSLFLSTLEDFAPKTVPPVKFPAVDSDAFRVCVNAYFAPGP